MEQWFGRLQSTGTEHWRAEHSHHRAETAAGHPAGIAMGPAGVRMAGGPKILVLDGYEGYSHKRLRVWRESSSQGISLEESGGGNWSSVCHQGSSQHPCKTGRLGLRLREKKVVHVPVFSGFVKVCWAVTFT